MASVAFNLTHSCFCCTASSGTSVEESSDLADLVSSMTSLKLSVGVESSADDAFTNGQLLAASSGRCNRPSINDKQQQEDPASPVDSASAEKPLVRPVPLRMCECSTIAACAALECERVRAKRFGRKNAAAIALEKGEQRILRCTSPGEEKD